MLNIKKLLLIPVVAIACLFTRIDSAYAVDYPFSITLINQTSSSWNFNFLMSAKGTFYVDCGTDGKLSYVGVAGTGTTSTTVSGNTVTKGDVKNVKLRCTYTSPGQKTIRFGGLATEYNTGTAVAALAFYRSGIYFSSAPEKIESISGDLTAIFPYISSASGYYPSFSETFRKASNLTGYIPSTLFSGLTAIGSPDVPMNDTFNGSQLALSCPPDKKQYITGYELLWRYRSSGTVSGGSLAACGDPITCASGKYLPAGSTTCNASCPSGYTCPAGTVGGNAKADENKYAPITLTWDGANATPASCNVGGTFVPPTPTHPGYIFAGWRQTCASKVRNFDEGPVSIDYGFSYGNGTRNISKYGLTNNQWAAEYSNGTVWGTAKCSETSGNNSSYTCPESSKSNWLKTPSNTAGKYCWCRVTGFSPSGSDYTQGPLCTIPIIASSLWVYENYSSDISSCEKYCIKDCVFYSWNYDWLEYSTKYTTDFRKALFSTAGQ